MKASYTAVSCLCLAMLVFGRGAHASGFVSFNKCEDETATGYDREVIGKNVNYTIPLNECTLGLSNGFSDNQWDTGFKARMKDGDDTKVELVFYISETPNLGEGAKCEGQEDELHECTCDTCCEFTHAQHDSMRYRVDCTNKDTEIETVNPMYYSDVGCSTLIGKDTMLVGCTGGRGQSGDSASTKVAVNTSIVSLTQYDHDTACGSGREPSITTYDIDLTLTCAIGDCCKHSESYDKHPWLNEPNILYVKFEDVAETPSNSDKQSTCMTVSLLSIFLVVIFGNVF